MQNKLYVNLYYLDKLVYKKALHNWLNIILKKIIKKKKKSLKSCYDLKSELEK